MLAAFAILVVIGVDVYCVMNMRGWIKGAFFEEVMGPDCWSTWIIIVSVFLIFISGRFIVRRLMWRFKPPEKEVRKASEYDEEVL